MSTEQNVLQDLKDICAQTKARYLMYEDIHTEDYERDSALFIKEMGHIGIHCDELLEKALIVPEYGGGFSIKHHDEKTCGGYTQEGNRKCLMVLPGFHEDREKETIYHEAAHVYQYKYNILDVIKNDDYTKYRTEVHANVFSTMVSLLKAKSILDYKKQKLSRFLEGVATINSDEEELIYYLSLPIELALMREIRKKGRLKTKEEFSKHGILDYKKIAFYTAQLVKKHCFSQEEFEKIKNKEITSKYEKLKRKAKAYRILGSIYVFKKERYYIKKENKHHQLEIKRLKKIAKKLAPLCENNEENKVINALCQIDNCQVYLAQDVGFFPDLELVVTEQETIPERLEEDEKKWVEETFQKIKTIYEKWKENDFFQKYFAKINDNYQRNVIWDLKEQKKKELEQRCLANMAVNER